MNSTRKIAFLGALAILALPVVAQTASTTPPPVTGQSIQDRKENQQDRIARA